MRQEQNSCTICGGAQWISMDHLRDPAYWWERNIRPLKQPVGFQVCQACGYITYAQILGPDEMQKHYTTERKTVSGIHHVTCGRKNAMHRGFLGDERVKAWVGEGRSIMDIGCAQGSFLNMLHQKYDWPKDRMLGTEWAEGFAMFGRKVYGLTVVKDPPEGKKWDVISLYRVLEHLKDPARELARFKTLLSDRGLLYLSVPVWLDVLEDPPGDSAKDFENIFHLNHCNVFTRRSLRNLLAKVGFKILEENTTMYQETMLLEPCDPSAIVPENPQDICRDLELSKKACAFLKDDKPAEAIACWKKLPEAWIHLAFHHENMRDPMVSEQVLRQALEIMPDHWRLLSEYGHLLFRIGSPPYGSKGMTPKLEEAERVLLKSLAVKPGQDMVLGQLGMLTALYRDDFAGGMNYWRQLLEINPLAFKEVWDKAGAVCAGVDMNIPTRVQRVPMQAPKPRDDIQMVVVPGMERMQMSDPVTDAQPG